MTPLSPIPGLQAALSASLGKPVHNLEFAPLGGGSINHAYRLLLNRSEAFFCKVNSAERYPGLFEKEKNGLELLAGKGIIRLPHVVLCDIVGDRQVLVMEWIEPGLKTGRFWQEFGRRLAALHQVTSPLYGLQEDNYMGSLPQHNGQMAYWPEFFWQQR